MAEGLRGSGYGGALPWSDEEEAELARLDRLAGGKLGKVVRLADGVLGRSYRAIRDKRCRLGLDRRSKQLAVEAGLGLGDGGVVPLELAPRTCPGCGGRWRLERDDDAWVLVCWVCARDVYVRVS